MGNHDDGRDVLRITQAQVMRAVSNPARMRVLALLRERSEQTVGQVCDVLGMPAGSASYHLHRLAEAGLSSAWVARGPMGVRAGGRRLMPP